MERSGDSEAAGSGRIRRRRHARGAASHSSRQGRRADEIEGSRSAASTSQTLRVSRTLPPCETCLKGGQSLASNPRACGRATPTGPSARGAHAASAQRVEQSAVFDGAQPCSPRPPQALGGGCAHGFGTAARSAWTWLHAASRQRQPPTPGKHAGQRRTVLPDGHRAVDLPPLLTTSTILSPLPCPLSPLPRRTVPGRASHTPAKPRLIGERPRCSHPLETSRVPGRRLHDKRGFHTASSLARGGSLHGSIRPRRGKRLGLTARARPATARLHWGAGLEASAPQRRARCVGGPALGGGGRGGRSGRQFLASALLALGAVGWRAKARAASQLPRLLAGVARRRCCCCCSWRRTQGTRARRGRRLVLTAAGRQYRRPSGARVSR